MPINKTIDGIHLGIPGQSFRIHSVDGSPNTFLLFAQAPLVVEEAIPVVPTSNHFLDAIAHVTGYTLKDLTLEHDFEKDLGIDFIKKKRIIHFLTENTALSKEQAAKLGSAKTIEEWSQILSPTQQKEPEETLSKNLPQREEDIIELLLQVTQEKTGYDRELLNLDADLEADLGIDTIKQAQIAGQIRKFSSISFHDGLRIKDFPTLRHWVHFIQKQTLSAPIAPVETELDRSVFEYREDIIPELQIDSVQVPAIHFLIIEQEPTLLSSLLSESLIKRGAKKVQVIRKQEISALDSVIQEETIEGIIYLAPMGIQIEVPQDSLHSALDCLKLVQKFGKSLQYFIAATGLQDEQEMVLDGAVRGFVRTLAIEYPTIRTRILELNRAEVSAQPRMIVDYLIREIDEAKFREIGYGFGKQWHPQIVAEPLNLGEDPYLRIDHQSVILFSGGLGGIGLEISKDLAKNYHPRLIFLGRTPESDPNVLNQLQILRDLGSECEYFSCHVTDESAVREHAKWIRSQYGFLTGIIHAAGTLEDRGISTKAEDSFSRVFQVKVQGARNLSQAALESNALFFCTFGSVSGRFGNMGQCDYAAANAAMSSLICRLRALRPTMRSFSISWGAWDEIGMAARTGVSDLLKSSNQGVISPREGLIAFKNELFFGGNSNEIVIRSLPLEQLKTQPRTLQTIAMERYYFLDEILSYFKSNRLIAKRTLDLEKDLWLKDHEILGTPVLPATFGIEIMTQAAFALFPDYFLHEVRDLKIHQAIQIEAQKPSTIRIRAYATANTNPYTREVHVLLEHLILNQSETFQIAYEAIISLNSQEKVLPRGLTQTDEKAEADQDKDLMLLGQTEIYQNIPHGIPLGPSFHVLSEVQLDGTTEAYGKVSRPLHSNADANASPTLCVSQPYAREAGFHAAALIRMKQSKEVLIPKSIRNIRHLRPISQEDGLRVKAVYKEHHTFDLFIFDSEMNLCTEILDFQTSDISSLTKDWNPL